MKTISYTKNIIILIIIIIGLQPTYALDWQISTMYRNSKANNNGFDCAIALNMDGYLASCFSINISSTKHLIYTYWGDFDAIHFEDIDSGNVDAAGSRSIVIDKNGNAHILYYSNYKRVLKYAKRINGSWVIEEIDKVENYYEYTNNSGETFNKAQLSLDSNGNPHIVYLRVEDFWGNDNRLLIHGWKDNNIWKKEILVQDRSNAPGGCALAIDNFDRPNLIFYQYNRIYHYIKKESTWETSTIKQDISYGGGSSIDISKNGTIAVALYTGYTGSNLSNDLIYGVKTNSTRSSWSFTTIDSQGEVGENPILKLDFKEDPRIVYRDVSNNDIKYAYLEKGQWHVETISSYGYVGQYHDLAINAIGEPHICFTDESYNELIFARPMVYGPGPFSLISPNNGNWSVATPEFLWYPSSYHGGGLSRYELFIDGNQNLSSIQPTRTFANITNQLTDGWHTWRVKAVQINNNEIFSTETWSFRVDATPPDAFQLSSPTNNIWSTNRKPTFSWSNSNDAGSLMKCYQLYIDNKMVVDKIDINTRTISLDYDLIDGKHTWYVMALDNADNKRQSSQIWSINIDQTPPSDFNVTSPEDNLWIANSTLTFRWEQSTDAGVGLSGYDLKVATVNIGNFKIFSIGKDSTQYTFKSADSLNHGSHRWYVNAIDSLGNYRESDVRTIKIDRIPPIIALKTPLDSSFVNFPTPSFSWLESTDDGSGLSHYQLWIDNALSVDHFNSTSTAPSSPISEGPHTWFVRAIDIVGNVGTSATRVVFGEWNPPQAFDIISPENASNLNIASPIFKWHSATDQGSGIGKYQLWLNGELNKDNIPANDTTTTPQRNLSNGDYTWFIKAFDRAGNYRNSTSTFSFNLVNVNHPPNPFSLISPSNHETIDTLNINFHWMESIDSDQGDSLYYVLWLGEDSLFTINKQTFKTTNAELPNISGLTKGATYFWCVYAVDRDSAVTRSSNIFSFTISSIATGIYQEGSINAPRNYFIYQNFPNPFNPETIIQYDIPKKEHIKLRVLNLQGQTIALLVDNELSPGTYHAVWSGKDENGNRVANGIYLYELQGGSNRLVRRMVFLK